MTVRRWVKNGLGLASLRDRRPSIPHFFLRYILLFIFTHFYGRIKKATKTSLFRPEALAK